MSILMKKDQLNDNDFEQGIELLTEVILTGCGVKGRVLVEIESI